MRELDLRIETGRSTRATERQDKVADLLRDRIIGGEFAPGSRLPIRVEIEQALNVSSVTVQRALDQLRQEGFVVAKRRSGTYVAAEPPHLSHYALVFPCHPGDLEWNMFWTAMQQEAKKIESQQNCKLPVFYGVDGHEDSEDYQRLLRGIHNQCFAGIILANEPSRLLQTPIFSETNMARVMIARSNRAPETAGVYFDAESLCKRAVEKMAEQKRQRIAIIKQVAFDFDFEAEIARHNFISHRYWIQDISLWSPETARGVIHLMMHDKERERPDALIVTDDNLLEPVLMGLRDAGVSVPDELSIIAHGNFPLAKPSSLPVQRIGFDISQLLQICIEEINHQCRGLPVTGIIRLPALFEDEVAHSQIYH